MTFFRQRGLVTAGLALFLTAGPVGTAAAQPVSFSDPDDVDLPLDLKTLTHDHNESTIMYTAEAYDSFDDSKIDVKWAIDRDNDGKVDLFAAVGYEDQRLEAKVEDADDREVGRATVRRLSDRAIQLSFSRKLVGASYQYWVMAATDSNGNEEDDAGEFDLAPDTGFRPHQL